MTRSTFFRKLLLACLALMVVLLGGVAGCLSPTLPLPPPGEPGVTPADESGVVSIHGPMHSAQPGALVFVLNQRTNEGVITTAQPEGDWFVKIGLQTPCVAGDHLAIWQQVGDSDSDNVIVQVPEPFDE